MSAVTATPVSGAPAPLHRGSVTQIRVALSEWTKLRTIRSTRYALLVGIFMTIAFAIIAALAISSRWNSMSLQERLSFNPLTTALIGVNIAQLAIGVLGVLVISGEYSTGMIRSTFAAVPKRLPVLWAKAGVFGAVTLTLTLPATVIAFFATQAILRGHSLNGRDIALSFSDPGVARAVIGGALYLALIGLFAFGLGAILRSTAGGISAFAAIVFVLPPLVNALPASWGNAISPYLPSNAGRAIMQTGNPANTLGPWTGLAVLAGYSALTIAIAAIQLRRRDV